MTTEIKSPLTKWGKEIRDFCEQHPQVTFNAPAQDQKEFRESLAGMAITENRIGLQSMLFTNKLMQSFFQSVEVDDMIMMFVGAGEGVYLTIIAKLEEFYRADDIPVNGRVDFHQTKTFKKEYGRHQNLWLGPIVAATCVKHLSQEMCIPDPKGEIFKQKAIKYGMKPHEYHQMHPRLKLLDTGERVLEVSNGVIYESPIYRTIEVSGGSVLIGECRVQSGTRLTSCALNHIGAVKPNASIDMIPRM